MRQAFKRALICAATFFASSAFASWHTFAGVNDFEFSNDYIDGKHVLKVCIFGTAMCQYSERAEIVPGRYIDSKINSMQSGAAVRGDLSGYDPSGTAKYYSMDFELHTRNFFALNPTAHIVIAPRALLPFDLSPYGYPGVMYNGYPPMPPMGGGVLPYGLGDGMILGNVPCKARPDSSYLPPTDSHMGIAIEHFFGPWAPQNMTACPGGSGQIPIYNTVYRVQVVVEHFNCVDPSTGLVEPCRRVGYKVKIVGPVFGAGTVAQGGLDASFHDTIHPGPYVGQVQNQGWYLLKPEDVSSWYIAHVFTSANASTDRWSFAVRNLQRSVSSILPSWWTEP